MSDVDVVGIDRVLIATNGLEASTRQFTELLGVEFGATIDPPTKPVANRTSRIGVEFVSGEDGSGIERFLERNGPGLYALSLEVSDVSAAREALAADGVEPVDEVDLDGFHEVFYHPSSFEDVMLILTEYDQPHPAESAAAESGWTRDGND
ncbi:VOC family protein [Natrarchaeobius sp. A-rgal3]|uniref:VOC family protein n=1 Tax=Natrarchaeobius versutus TaxID=1679078 RepID=UPI00350F29B5